MEQVLRYCQSDSWTPGRKCRVSHQVALQRLHERDPGILAATTAIGPQLIVGFGLQRDAQAARRPPDRRLH